MPNVGFIKQIMDGKGVFNSLLNLVNYQSLLANLVPLSPCLKLFFIIKYIRIRLMLVSLFELCDRAVAETDLSKTKTGLKTYNPDYRI